MNYLRSKWILGTSNVKYVTQCVVISNTGKEECVQAVKTFKTEQPRKYQGNLNSNSYILTEWNMVLIAEKLYSEPSPKDFTLFLGFPHFHTTAIALTDVAKKV